MYLFFFLMIHPLPTSALFPYTTLFRSLLAVHRECRPAAQHDVDLLMAKVGLVVALDHLVAGGRRAVRSEEHTSELQSHHDLVCRLLLEKKKSSAPSPQ